MVEVSNAARVVFPEIGITKGDVVRYYERIAPRLLPHVAGRPLSIRRFPKGLSGAGFFQKNVPAHYPDSIERFGVQRNGGARKGRGSGEDVTIYPIVHEAEHLAFLANQGTIELHVPTSRASAIAEPDRIVFDLDPPPGAVALVRRAAFAVRETFARFGLKSVPVCTGSKGYHVVASIHPTQSYDVITVATQKLAALVAAEVPDVLTVAFRVVQRGGKVFVDWLRNRHGATVVAPYSLRARPRAPVCVPIAWSELETTAPDAFSIEDVGALLDRPDVLAEQDGAPDDAGAFASAVEAAFDASGLTFVPFDRFRS